MFLQRLIKAMLKVLYFENDFANFVLLEMFTTRIFLRGAGAGG
jgi:hypothetical protein